MAEKSMSNHGQAFFPKIQLQKKKFDRKVLSGTGIDEVYEKKTINIQDLENKLNFVTKEKDELKMLNKKLNDKVDFL